MGTGLSNTSPGEFAKHQQQLQTQQECGVCGADREQALKMLRFEQDIVAQIREMKLVKRNSCIQCVQKHVGKAMVLYKELLTAKEGSNVNGPLNHLEVIGNLQAAADEAQQWPKLCEAIDMAEREYRYRGIGPDWEQLAAKINEVASENHTSASAIQTDQH